MGGKTGKYVYVKRRDGWYVKVRVFKGKSDDDPDKYLPVGFKTKRPPHTYEILDEEELPEEARGKLYL